MKRVLRWLVHWAPRAGTIAFCPALAALVPIAQQPGQAVVLGRLSLRLWSLHKPAAATTP
jgi:hypothetical protein